MAAASDQNTKYDYPRLQRAVEALLGAHDGLRRENEQLRANADAHEDRVRELEGALREQQQRRANAIARIDTLVSELEELDRRLERAEETKPVAVDAPAASSLGSAAP